MRSLPRLACVDRAMVTLVRAALAHANGSHEHAEFMTAASDGVSGLVRPGAVFAWPQAALTGS